MCAGTQGGDLQGPELPGEPRGPNFLARNKLNLQCPTPNKPKMVCIFGGPDLAV